MKYFSMFSGIGGFELGIGTKGECIGYSEIDKYSIQTYEKNFGGTKNYGDCTKIITDELPDFDLLVGGFPCQAFSIAGKRRGFEDTRGTLFFEIARILKGKQPSMFVLENVKGLLNHDGGNTFTKILQTIDELGYDAEWQVLNSKHFGVPQNRERVFIIGCLRGSGETKVFPIRGSNTKTHPETLIDINQAQRVYSTNGTSITLKSLGGEQGAKTGLYSIKLSNMNMQGRRIKEENEESFTLGAGGGCENGIYMNTLKEATGNRAGSSKEFLRSVDNINKSIGQIRRLTPTECERLQGFPDGWTEGISDTQRYKQLGNAVTVNVVEAIIKKVLKN